MGGGEYPATQEGRPAIPGFLKPRAAGAGADAEANSRLVIISLDMLWRCLGTSQDSYIQHTRSSFTQGAREGAEDFVELPEDRGGK